MFVEALTRLLVAEHKKDPIRGRVLALGKQTIDLSLSKILEIFKEQNCEINPNFDFEKYQTDTSTRYRKDNNIDDTDFLKLFADVTYDTMDISSYEKATIIHDFNKPIPKKLKGKFDFIIDGGTFDHLFDVKTSFTNVVKLLKPGGRIFQWNAASNFANMSYLSFGADFFYDYYVLNKFIECRTYFAESYSPSAQNWCLYEFLMPDNCAYPCFRKSDFFNMVIVLARKGKNSTFDKHPIQSQYRDQELQKEYTITQKEINDSKKLSLETIKLSDVKMPIESKSSYELLAKPDDQAYKYIGWL